MLANQVVAMLHFLELNSASIVAVATAAILVVTLAYAIATFLQFMEARRSRLVATTPNVVAYFRVHDVHSNMVQLHVANLTGAAARQVTVSISKLTEWPEKFDLDESNLLRDISFLRPNEILKFDVGIGPELFRDNSPARFEVQVDFESLDGRPFDYRSELRIESVLGGGNYQIYGIDDIARKLEKISKSIDGWTGFKRLRVDAYTSADRQEERRFHEEARARRRNSD